MALSNGRELLERVMEGGHAMIFASGERWPVRLMIYPHSICYKTERERGEDYGKFQMETIQKLDRYEAMRETRKNEERYQELAAKVEAESAKPQKTEREIQEERLREALFSGESELKERSPGLYTTDELEATRKRPSVIEKLTAPPPVSDKIFRLLLDLWMYHDTPGEQLGARLNEAVTEEAQRRGLDLIDAYHTFKENK